MGLKHHIPTSILIFIALMLFIDSVSAVGIRGDNLRITMDFIPHYEQQLVYRIRPTVSYTQDYKVYVQGALAPYIELEKELYSNVRPNEYPTINAVLKLPAELEPGMHEGLVGVIDTVATGGGNAAIGTMTSVRAVVRVRSLYPDAYPVITFEPENVNEGETATMLVKVSNWGKKQLDDGYAIIKVYDSNNKDEAIATLQTNKVDIMSGATKEVSAEFETQGFEPGQYYAEVLFKSNAPDVSEESYFNIGTMEIIVEEYPETVYSGAVKPIEIWLRSRWGKDLDNVFATVRINGFEADTNIKNLRPWGYDKFRAFIDGSGFETGPSEMEIEIKQDDYRNIVTVPVTVVKAPAQAKAAPFQIPDLFILFVIFIVAMFAVINTVMYIKFKRYGEAYQ